MTVRFCFGFVVLAWLALLCVALPSTAMADSQRLAPFEDGPSFRIEPFAGLYIVQETARSAGGTLDSEFDATYPTIGINAAVGGTMWGVGSRWDSTPSARLGLELQLGYLYSWNSSTSLLGETKELHQMQAMTDVHFWLREIVGFSVVSGYRFLQTTYSRSFVPDSVRVEHVPMVGLGAALQGTLQDGLKIRLDGRWLVDARGTLDLFSGSLRFFAGSLVLGILADAVPKREFTRDGVTFTTQFAATAVFTIGVRG